VGAVHEAVEEEAEDGAHWQELPCLHLQLLQKHHHLLVGAEAEEEEVVREVGAAEAAGSLLLKASRFTRSAPTATAT
jgi:hypothetical protein